MIFSITFALALLLTHVAHALPHADPNTRSTTARATFDYTYDNASGSLNGVACSNGANGSRVTIPRRSAIFPPSLLSAARPALCGTHLTAAGAGN